MYVRVKKSTSRKSVVQLVEGVRDSVSGRVKQRVIRHVGSAADEAEVERLKELGQYLKHEIEAEHQPSFFSPEESLSMTSKSKSQQEEASGKDYAIDDFRNLREEQRTITGIHEIYGSVYNQLGFDKILQNPARNKHSCETIRNIVLGRIASPASKRETVNILASDYGIRLNLDSVYKAMDKLDENAINKLQDCALAGARNLFNEKIDVLFYDATTLYFESFTEDEPKSKGFSKDNKFNEVQVMLSVFVTQAGIPVGYEVFPGSTYEGHTLMRALDNLGKRFDVGKVVFVADSGLLSRDNLALLEESGYQYIVGARLKSMPKNVVGKILSKEGYQPLQFADEECSYKLLELDENQQLVVNYNATRARKDAYDRDKAIAKLREKMRKSKKVKSMVNASGYKKYLNVDSQAEVEINQEKIDEDQQWDGIHGVVTNIKGFNPQEIISQYRGLWQVEETFRLSKHDLKVRPIYHWTPERIKAHIAICFIALTCVRHLEYRVNLQSKKMSPERMRKALTATGITTLRHVKDKRLFAVPFKLNDDAKTIYKTMNKSISDQPYLIKS